MAVHTTTLTIVDNVSEPTVKNAFSNLIAQSTGRIIVLNLTDFFSDLKTDNRTDDTDALAFTATSSMISGSNDIIAIRVNGQNLTLTGASGASRGLWRQETVTITAMDAEGGRTTAEFAVTTRGNLLDTTHLAPAQGFIVQGDMADDRLGESVSGAGGLNGDGFDDLIVGAEQGDDGRNFAGEGDVVYGGAHLGEVVTTDQTLAGMAVVAASDPNDEAAVEAAARMAFLHGGAGDDTLEAHTDTEVLYGGAGDDVLELVDTSFRRVDGGAGVDTLVLGMAVTLNFTEASDRGRVRGIETLSLSDATAMVTLDLFSVYALVEARDNGGTLTDAGEAFLRLEGSSGMVVLSDRSSWTEEADAEGTADLWVQGSAKLLIDDGLLAG